MNQFRECRVNKKPESDAYRPCAKFYKSYSTSISRSTTAVRCTRAAVQVTSFRTIIPSPRKIIGDDEPPKSCAPVDIRLSVDHSLSSPSSRQVRSRKSKTKPNGSPPLLAPH